MLNIFNLVISYVQRSLVKSIEILTPTMIGDRGVTTVQQQTSWDYPSSRTNAEAREWSRSISSVQMPGNFATNSLTSTISGSVHTTRPTPSSVSTILSPVAAVGAEAFHERPLGANFQAQHPTKNGDRFRVRRSPALHAPRTLVNFPTMSSRASSSSPRRTEDLNEEVASQFNRESRLSRAGQEYAHVVELQHGRRTRAISPRSLSRSRSLDGSCRSIRSNDTSYHSCESTPSSIPATLPPSLLDPPPLALPTATTFIHPPVRLPFPVLEDQRVVDSRERTWHTLMELLDTEKGYLDDLRMLITSYQDPLAEAFDLTSEEMVVVARNSRALLRLHETLQPEFAQVEDLVCVSTSSSSSPEDSERTLQRRLSSNPAEAESTLARGIDLAARIFLMNACEFDIYQEYCAGHTEALDIIRRLQTSRPTDWDAFERKCAMSALFTPTTRSTPTPTPSTPTNTINVRTLRRYTVDASLSVITAVTPDQPGPPAEQDSPSSGGGGGSGPKLSYMDILIKPIQRVCRYPLLLAQLRDAVSKTSAGLKHRSDADPEGLLDLALEIMKGVVNGVDEAEKARDGQAKTKVIAARMDGHSILTQPILACLGDCVLAGALDVVYHHIILSPLRTPMKARYLGAFLYSGFIILAKVRRGKMYEPKHWFPLKNAQIVDTAAAQGETCAGNGNAIGSMMANSFRISIGLHHFELAATSTAEKDLWVKAAQDARTTVCLPVELNVPTSLPSTVISSTFNNKNQPTGTEDMARFLADPFPSVGQVPSELPSNTEDAVHPPTETSSPTRPATHVRSLSATTLDGSSSGWGATPPVIDVTTPTRRPSIFGGSGDRLSTIPLATAPSSVSLVRRDSSAQHLIVDRNLSDVFSVPCLTLRTSAMKGFTTPSAGIRTQPWGSTVEENKSLINLTGRTNNLSKARTRVLSRTSSMGSLFYRRSSLVGVYSASGTSGDDTPTSASDLPTPLDRYNHGIPPALVSSMSSRARRPSVHRRSFLKSLTLLSPSSGGSDPSIVVEAEDEGESGTDIRTPDSGYFADGRSPISPTFAPGSVSKSTSASPEPKSRRRAAKGHPRHSSIGQNLLELFSKHGNSINSMPGNFETNDSGTPTEKPTVYHCSPSIFVVGDSVSNTPSPRTTPASLVQRGVAYVRRKRALSSPGKPIQHPAGGVSSGSQAHLMASVSIRPSSIDVAPNEHGSTSVNLLGPPATLHPVRTKTSIVSLRAMFASTEPRRRGSKSTVSSTGSSRSDRSRARSSQLDEQPFNLSDEQRQKLVRKSSRGFMKRALFQI
ncbi:hypothetical protein FRB97_000161 [Tulasnella sp. 331]|nr:hypothetical protein FRB97_000161 [Tulasnella sp. 331]